MEWKAVQGKKQPGEGGKVKVVAVCSVESRGDEELLSWKWWQSVVVVGGRS